MKTKWFEYIDSKAVNTPFGSLLLDMPRSVGDSSKMFMCNSGYDYFSNYFAFLESEETPEYEQWYMTPVTSQVRNKIVDNKKYISELWDREQQKSRVYFCMRHWFEDNSIEVWETEDNPLRDVENSNKGDYNIYRRIAL